MRYGRTLLLACLVINVSCAARTVRSKLQCTDPDQRLQLFWNELQDARQSSNGCATVNGVSPCDRLRRDISTLAYMCPANTAALLANAILAYDARQIFLAQQLLDEILSKPGVRPEAAVLRSRIAIEEGNVPYASRFIQEQIRLNPDYAELREMLAATFFLTAQYDDAIRELNSASTLGSPRWRIAYHLGLISEAKRDIPGARRLYQEVLQLKPGWSPAESRLKGLNAIPPTP
jgi:predicted Zn-dependent protease